MTGGSIHVMNNDMNEHLAAMLQDAFSRLMPLLDDASIREVMVNGEDNVWIERDGQLEKTACHFSRNDARNAIQILATMTDREVGMRAGEALFDAAFLNMRVSAVLSPIATQGHALCIRKLAGLTKSLSDYLPDSPSASPSGSSADQVWDEDFRIPEIVHDRLHHWVNTRMNILVSGGTSTGKTTFLNALIRVMPATDRLITIEDTRELIVDLPNHVSFEANASLAVSVRDLVRQTLRFRPDRIVVGEVRGGEAFDLIQAMNTGHDGCLGTLHANSAFDALGRLEQMVMQCGVDWSAEAIARQIASCIDGVIHLSRIGGVRQIENMIQVEGYRNGAYQTQTLLQQT
ncbi:MAG: CpaF family protein [Burkholderiales bacterium]